MISHQLQSTPVTGYFEYLSRNRHRVNVSPHEETDNDDAVTQTTTTTTTATVIPSSDDTVMINDNPASVTDTTFADNVQEQQQQSLNITDKDVTKWSSTEVQQWVDEQCQKFELKKTTIEKFQMNGQALVLLTKHDFIRRSSDGGEILYYALQRLINPNKNKSIRAVGNSTRNGSWRHSTRIVELGSDTDEHNSSTTSPSPTKPIIEEPDDPPLYRKSESDTMHENYHHHYPHSYYHSNSYIRQPYFTMPNAAYYHQHQAYPNNFMYAHHVHPHMSQQQYYHPHQHQHYAHQYPPTMSAQEIVIEVIDNEKAKNSTADGINLSGNDTSTNGASSDSLEQFMVTINGQRYVMSEEQVNLYVAEVQRLQQQQQQQQQHYQQQQQQQHFQQQQQQQQQHYQQQQQQPQHQHYQQQQQHFHPQQQQQQQQFRPHQQQQYANQQRQPSQDNIFHTS